MLCAFGILAALVERQRSGKGQVVDCSMSEGAAYVGSWLTQSRNLPIWQGGRGENVLDGGAFFYGAYETSDGKYMSVGALEPQFYNLFMETLGLDLDQFDPENEKCKEEVQRKFKTKTQSEWSELFEKVDACVFPVVDWENAHQYPHNVARKAFVPKELTDNVIVPAPAPILSRTPAVSSVQRNDSNKDYLKQVEEVFGEIGLKSRDIQQLYEDGVLMLPTNSKL